SSGALGENAAVAGAGDVARLVREGRRRFVFADRRKAQSVEIDRCEALARRGITVVVVLVARVENFGALRRRVGREREMKIVEAVLRLCERRRTASSRSSIDRVER